MKWQFDAVQFRHDASGIAYDFIGPKSRVLKCQSDFITQVFLTSLHGEKVITSFLDNLLRDFTLAENCITSDNCIY